MILYMENGDVAEIGTHEQLMKQGGKYAALYAAASDAIENRPSAAPGMSV